MNTRLFNASPYMTEMPVNEGTGKNSRPIWKWPKVQPKLLLSLFTLLLMFIKCTDMPVGVHINYYKMSSRSHLFYRRLTTRVHLPRVLVLTSPHRHTLSSSLVPLHGVYFEVSAFKTLKRTL